MTLPTVLGHPWRPSRARICRRCATVLLQRPPQWPQARTITGKAFAKYGPKYTAKIDAANEEWAKRAERIESGAAKPMWDILNERGYVKDVAGNPDEIRTLLTKKRIGAYVGIDPTAPSLHVGHLLPLMPLFWMYVHGYRAVSLVGGATAKIGDPTDRLQTRNKLRNSDVAMNMVKIHYQLKKIWSNVEDQARRYGYEKTWAWRRGLLQNGHWWNKLPMLEVLQRLGSGMRIGPMMSRETVKRKMTQGDGMSFAEFSYPLLQAWDWWHMYVSQGVQLQIGGSDQYGNIVTGIDALKVIRASEPNPAMRLPEGGQHEPVGFTVPLLTDSSGAKFGKSAGNAMWLDRFQTTTRDLYGYFMRRPDEDVERLLRLFTFMPLEEIGALMEAHAIMPSRRVPHHALAYEVVLLVHGKTEADEARAYHEGTYGNKTQQAHDSGQQEDAKAHPTTLNNAPRVDIQLPVSLIRQGKVARILYAAGMVKSVSEGNRLAIQKGAYVGAAPGQTAHRNKGMLLTQVDYTPVHLWYPEDTKNFVIDDKYMILRKGQHNVRVIEIVSDEAWAASGQTYPGEPYAGRTRRLREQLKTLRAAMTADAAGTDDAAQLDAAAAAAQAEFEADQAEQVAEADGKLTFPDEKPTQIRELEAEIQSALRQREEQGKA